MILIKTHSKNTVKAKGNQNPGKMLFSVYLIVIDGYYVIYEPTQAQIRASEKIYCATRKYLSEANYR